MFFAERTVDFLWLSWYSRQSCPMDLFLTSMPNNFSTIYCRSGNISYICFDRHLDLLPNSQSKQTPWIDMFCKKKLPFCPSLGFLFIRDCKSKIPSSIIWLYFIFVSKLNLMLEYSQTGDETLILMCDTERCYTLIRLINAINQRRVKTVQEILCWMWNTVLDM